MTGGPDLHALVVGVDRYLPPPEGEVTLYGALRGAVADARAVARYLEELLDVPGDQVELLTASGLGPEPTEPRERWPTYPRLVAALERLEERTSKGDQALVFFAGHGGRMLTAWPEHKGHGQVDEGWAPVDVQLPEGRYLRDGELAAWVERQRRRGVFVSLVLDCCHAGGLRRLPVGARIRGPVRHLDRRSLPGGSELASRREIHRALDHRRRWAGGGFGVGEGAVLLAACRDVEQAFEDSFGDGPRGVLTHYLLEALEGLGEVASWRHLHAAVATRVRGRVRRQTPCLVGDVERCVFGREHLPVLWGVDVLGREAGDAEAGPAPLWIATGHAQGVLPGARFDLHSLAAARQPRPGEPLARGRVVAAEAGRCRLEPESSEGAWQELEPGDRAVLLDPGEAVTRRRVALEVEPGAGPAADEMALRLQRFLESPACPRLMRVEPREPAELRVVLGAVPAASAGERVVQIRSGLGELLPHVPGVSLAGLETAGSARDEAERHLTTTLEHLGRYFSLQDLGRERAASPLAGQLQVRLAAVPRGSPPGSLAPGEPFSAVPPVLPPGRPFQLVVEHRGLAHLHVAVLDFAPDWAVALAHQSRLEQVERGRPYVIPLVAWLPENFPGGTDVLKVFFTRDEMDFDWMVQPSLEQAVARDAAREPPRWRSAPVPAPGGSLDPLDRARRLLGAAPAYRQAEDGAGGADLSAWVTAQVELRVERPPESPPGA